MHTTTAPPHSPARRPRVEQPTAGTGPAGAATVPATRAAAPDRRRAADGGRLRALDGLRLLAALAVCAYHYLALDDAAPAWGQPAQEVFPSAAALAPYGWLGVEVFFVISGFAIALSCWGRDLGAFFRSRVVRLFPAYWGAVLVTAAVVTALPVVQEAPTFDDVLVNLTMLQDPLGVPDVEPSYWTLWAELKFYLLFALVVWKGTTYRRVAGFCVAWTLAAAVARNTEVDIIEEVLIANHAAYFTAGVGIYLLHRFGHSFLTWAIIAVNLVIGLDRAVVRMEHQSADVVHQPLQSWVVAVLFLGGAGLVIAIARGHLAWVRWRWVTELGKLTYPFYLLHSVIGLTAIHVLHVRMGLSAYVVLPGVVVGMLAAAWLLHALVEVPLAGVVRRWVRSPLPQDEPAAAVLPQAGPATVVLPRPRAGS